MVALGNACNEVRDMISIGPFVSGGAVEKHIVYFERQGCAMSPCAPRVFYPSESNLGVPV